MKPMRLIFIAGGLIATAWAGTYIFEQTRLAHVFTMVNTYYNPRGETIAAFGHQATQIHRTYYWLDPDTPPYRGILAEELVYLQGEAARREIFFPDTGTICTFIRNRNTRWSDCSEIEPRLRQALSVSRLFFTIYHPRPRVDSPPITRRLTIDNRSVYLITLPLGPPKRKTRAADSLCFYIDPVRYACEKFVLLRGGDPLWEAEIQQTFMTDRGVRIPRFITIAFYQDGRKLTRGKIGVETTRFTIHPTPFENGTFTVFSP